MDAVIGLMPVSASRNHLLYMSIFAFMLAQYPGTRWPMVFMGIDYNEKPRENLRILEQKIMMGKTKITKRKLDTLKRMYAAHQNGMENLPLFYIAIVAALLAKLPTKEANAMAAFYLLTRLVFNILYILITSRALSLLRTFAYWAGMLTCFSMLWRSGDIIAKAQY